MNVTDVSTVSGWFGHQWKTYEYHTSYYEDGNSVTRVKSYVANVNMYTDVGHIERTNTLGLTIDKMI
jgi:hypothetical protein